MNKRTTRRNIAEYAVYFLSVFTLLTYLISLIFHGFFRPVLYFDRTPQGGLLNRFSVDINTADCSLSFLLNLFLDCLANLIGDDRLSLCPPTSVHRYAVDFRFLVDSASLSRCLNRPEALVEVRTYLLLVVISS